MTLSAYIHKDYTGLSGQPVSFWPKVPPHHHQHGRHRETGEHPAGSAQHLRHLPPLPDCRRRGVLRSARLLRGAGQGGGLPGRNHLPAGAPGGGGPLVVRFPRSARYRLADAPLPLRRGVQGGAHGGPDRYPNCGMYAMAVEKAICSSKKFAFILPFCFLYKLVETLAYWRHVSKSN